MAKISIIIIVSTIIHFIFDWISQSRDVAQTKKQNPAMLASHIAWDVIPSIIIIGFIAGIAFKASALDIVLFFILNVGSHFVIDGWLPSGETERELINWTAIDCILHLSILFASLNILM